MNKSKLSLSLLLIFAIIISGCNFPLSTEESGGEEEVISNVIATQVAQTMTALEAQWQQEQAYIEENPIPTITPEIVIPEPPQVPPAAPPPIDQSSCLIAGSVSETIPDDTAFAPQFPFNKTWTIINSGSCDWTTNYQLVFVSGEQMGGISPTYLSSNVPAGNIIDVPLALTAPTAPGTYRGDWGLRSEDGTIFAYFWVQIVVNDMGPFVITGATLASELNYTGACPYSFDFSADITANTFGSATYYFEFEDGSKSTPATLTFPYAGTLTATGSRDLTTTGPYSVKLYIDSPNRQYFGLNNFTLTCSP